MALKQIKNTIGDVTGIGRVSAQGDRDRKFVGDVARKTLDAQRSGIRTGMKDQQRQFDQNVRMNLDDISFAQEQAKTAVNQYKNSINQQWGDLIAKLNREKAMAIKSMREGQQDAEFTNRINALTQLAQTGIQAGLAVAPGIAQNIKASRDPLNQSLTPAEIEAWNARTKMSNPYNASGASLTPAEISRFNSLNVDGLNNPGGLQPRTPSRFGDAMRHIGQTTGDAFRAFGDSIRRDNSFQTTPLTGQARAFEGTAMGTFSDTLNKYYGTSMQNAVNAGQMYNR